MRNLTEREKGIGSGCLYLGLTLALLGVDLNENGIYNPLTDLLNSEVEYTEIACITALLSYLGFRFASSQTV